MVTWGGVVSVLTVTVLTVSLAYADEGGGGKAGSEFLLLVQIALLIGVGRGLGEVMQRMGQPSVIGELLAGLVLGPSLFGWIWPSAQVAIFPHDPAQKAMLDGIAQFGILLLLLLTGMEIDLKLVRKVGRPAVTISLFGIVLPFTCGFALGEFMPEGLLPRPEARLVAALFLGTALSISSIKIVAVVVREMNFMRRNVGQIIVASAIIDDTLGWIIIAVIFSLASQGSIDLASISKALLGTIAFLVFSFTLGRRLVFQLIRLANDHLVSASPVVTVILLLMSTMALITHLIGVHTVLGAFITGVLVGESPILTKQIDERLRGLIASLFMPVFFGLAGLGTDLTKLGSPELLLFTAALIVIASVGKFTGALAGGAAGGLTRRESLALASGMNARGSTEVIIASIGLSMGVLTQNLFSMIVTMAILTTLAMPPMLRGALARLPPRREEQDRLDREEFEDKGFVGNLERLLLAVDDGGNAELAAKVAGWLAAPRALPTTVFQVDPHLHAAESSETIVKEAARQGGVHGEIDVTTRVPEPKLRTTLREVVADEARKGFDLLLIGLSPVLTADGRFSGPLQELAAGFEGPLALVQAADSGHGTLLTGDLRILVPVSGSGVSRRGAEVAIAIARVRAARLHLIYVSTTRDQGTRRGTTDGAQERASQVLRETAAIAARYELAVTTRVHASAAPERAILQEIDTAGADLVVLGVDRLQGETLDFGSVAAAVLARSRVPVLLVSTEANQAASRPSTTKP
ncbi:cation:proton antiporter [Bradyrhizobium sp.]|uniref:cation:proton antiporter domain-containing protein n=1 Tax=Bradyrhizobium sp. TaxID=376 RepID=UPI003C7C8DC0